MTVQDGDRLDGYGTFLTNDLIWMREGDEPWGELLQQLTLAGDRPLIPLCVGLQSANYKSDFRVQPTMVSFLQQLAERVTIPTRGVYTAEILSRHGITNVQPLGCPSLYQLPLYPGALAGLARDVTDGLFAATNFGTFGETMMPAEYAFLRYMPDQFAGFIDQTFDLLPWLEAHDERLAQWMRRHIHAFFDLESWVRHNARYNFSMGARFHGNVVPLLSGTRSLFLTIDSRTREMTDFLRLPVLELAAFDPTRPLRHYYDMADYSDFLGHYRALTDGLVDYAGRHGLPLSPSYLAGVSQL